MVLLLPALVGAYSTRALIIYAASALLEGETTAAEQLFLQHALHGLGSVDQGIHLSQFMLGEGFPPGRGRGLWRESVEQGPDLSDCKASLLRQLNDGQPLEHTGIVASASVDALRGR